MGKIAARRLRRNGFEHRLTQGDAGQLPFPTNAFEQIVATFPSDYFLDPSTLKEAYRVLSPNGEILHLPIAWMGRKNPVSKFMAWLFKITGQNREKDHPLFDAGESILEQAGFVMSTEAIKFPNSKVLMIIAKKK